MSYWMRQALSGDEKAVDRLIFESSFDQKRFGYEEELTRDNLDLIEKTRKETQALVDLFRSKGSHLSVNFVPSQRGEDATRSKKGLPDTDLQATLHSMEVLQREHT